VPHPALIEAVHRQTADAVAAVWAEAKAAAERSRADAECALAERRVELDQQLHSTAASAWRAAEADGERRSRAIRAAARSALADRLFTLARQIAATRGSAAADSMAALARELPARTWTRVSVNAADVAAASALFGRCDIAADAAIATGIIVEGAGLRVSNTFDSRLRAAWPEMQPAVMKDVDEHLHRSRPAA
jgi:hypothetical protein